MSGETDTERRAAARRTLNFLGLYAALAGIGLIAYSTRFAAIGVFLIAFGVATVPRYLLLRWRTRDRR